MMEALGSAPSQQMDVSVCRQDSVSHMSVRAGPLPGASKLLCPGFLHVCALGMWYGCIISRLYYILKIKYKHCGQHWR